MPVNVMPMLSNPTVFHKCECTIKKIYIWEIFKVLKIMYFNLQKYYVLNIFNLFSAVSDSTSVTDEQKNKVVNLTKKNCYL